MQTQNKTDPHYITLYNCFMLIISSAVKYKCNIYVLMHFRIHIFDFAVFSRDLSHFPVTSDFPSGQWYSENPFSCDIRFDLALVMSWDLYYSVTERLTYVNCLDLHVILRHQIDLCPVMSIITVQLGQCGNQIGGQLFSTLLDDACCKNSHVSKARNLDYIQEVQDRYGELFIMASIVLSLDTKNPCFSFRTGMWNYLIYCQELSSLPFEVHLTALECAAQIWRIIKLFKQSKNVLSWYY